MYKIKKKRSVLKKIVPVAIVIAILAVSLVYFVRNRSSNKISSGTSGSTINYNPPTVDELAETKQQKETISSGIESAKDNPAGDSTATSKKVTPVISSWNYSESNLQASGFVPGVIESTGTCTLTVVNGSQSASASVPGTPNVQNVSCGLIKIPRSKLGSGSWKLTLEYSSPGHSGTSEPQIQEIN